MAKKESKPEIERSYNVPLRRGFHDTANYKKSAKAMRTLQEFLKKHMKTEDVLIGRRLNEFIWKHGIKNPPHHVKVHVWKKDDQVKAELEGYDFTGAVRSEKKKEPETMKEKLAAKLGVDTTKPEAEKKVETKEAAKQETADIAKPEVKKEKKSSAPKKKEADNKQ